MRIIDEESISIDSVEFSSSSQVVGNYKMEHTIGEGTFGKVKSAIHIPTEERVAIKILEKSKIKETDDLNRIIREMKILRTLNHPNIIKVFEVK